MGTFMGDLLRILAHGGMSAGTQALGQYLGNALTSEREMNLQGMKEIADQARLTSDPDTQQSLLGLMYEKMGTKPPMVTKTMGYAPPGLEPSAATPNPNAQLLQTQTSPIALKDMLGAEPVDRTRIAAPAPKLEQQLAEQVRETGVSPLDTMGYLKRIEQPRGEFATLVALSQNPDPAISGPAKAKLNQPNEMMEFRKDMAAQRAETEAGRRQDAINNHKDRLSIQQQQLQIAKDNAAQRGDTAEQKAIQQVLNEHGKYTKIWETSPNRKEAILEAGRSYNTARERYAEKYPDNVAQLPPPHDEVIVKGWFGGESQKPVAPSEKAVTPKGSPAATQEFVVKDGKTYRVKIVNGVKMVDPTPIK